MENELIEPEEAGFYPCDSGCAGNCPCCEAEDDEADEDEDFQKCWKLCPLSFTMCSGTTYRFTLSWSNP